VKALDMARRLPWAQALANKKYGRFYGQPSE